MSNQNQNKDLTSNIRNVYTKLDYVKHKRNKTACLLLQGHIYARNYFGHWCHMWLCSSFNNIFKFLVEFA